MSSLSATIQDVFNEPGCGKNANKSEANARRAAPSNCSPAARPAAAPSTAPRSPFNRSPTSPISCTARSPARAIAGTIAARSPPARICSAPASPPTSTKPTSSSAARSGCYKSIREIIDKYDPPAVFVYQTCVPAMIGDDIDAVCKAAREKFDKPVIPVNSPGFVGPEKSRQQACGRGAARTCDRHRRAGIYDALRHQHHRRIQSVRRIVAGEAAARRTRHSHPGLHLRRRQISRSRLLASRPGRDDGLLQGDDQCRAQDGGALRHPLLRRLLLRHRRYAATRCARSRAC